MKSNLENLLIFIFAVVAVVCLFNAYKSTTQEAPTGSLYCDRVWNWLKQIPVEPTQYRNNLEEKFFTYCGTFTRYQDWGVKFVSLH